MANRAMWQIEVRHKGLNKYRLIKGSDRYVVEQKAIAQQHTWDDMWAKKQVAEKKKKERESAIKNKEEKKALATAKTQEAQEAIDDLNSVLVHTLSVNDTIDWDELLDKIDFPEGKPSDIELNLIPPEPTRSDSKYQPHFGLFDKLSSKSKRKKEDKAESIFASDHEIWVKEKQAVKQENAKTEDDFANRLKKWKKDKEEYENRQRTRNNRILGKKGQYESKEPGAIIDYCEMVLANSKYPDYFPQEWDIEYQPDTQILVIDFSLPDLDSLPKLKTIKYVISRDEFSETYLSKAALNKLYDELLYQCALRTIHEIYEADTVNSIVSIVFNGWVDSIDKATGQNTNACIMSLQASKNEFLEINLERVDPKACFKKLKGIGSSKLHGLSPVAPIVNIDKYDRRFVPAYGVVDGVEETDNLASMDWQDFENLIREVFEKEFLSSGGEVKITQASRDGGVDAIAFDPDPIRGGKIVIQAKRYTNVVGVAAVRDLYGTTVNEGATKGILVTTADYGPDAYEFAKGKPLTLLNGSNLLHLLEKHGHKATIDLKEAKKILAEQKN